MAIRLQFVTAVLTRFSRLVAAFLLLAPRVFAASFIVPDDAVLARRAPVIVLATPLHSYAQLTANDDVETVTTLAIDEVIKGRLDGDTLDIVEPGGVFENRAQLIPGVPRFIDGERYLLFLIRSDGRWHVFDLAIGKFNLKSDLLGREVAFRDEPEIDQRFNSAHRGERRAAQPFLQFLRTAAHGGPAQGDYYVSSEPIVTTSGLRIVPEAAFTASSYTFIFGGNLGGRWNVFPSAVTFFSLGTEPGAPGGGTTAINASFASWNGDPNSNVNYVYGGADNGTHTKGVSASDGTNVIAFERDLTPYGAPAFQCTANSYNGTLGLGGITKATGTHSGPNAETFYTAVEGDVEMNKGIANCTLLFNLGDFDSAVAHEVGHTLGFRHSDQTRADDPSIPCTNDPSLECSTSAIMKAFIPSGLHAALQAWDQHAVAAVYPGGGTTSPPAAPTGVGAQALAGTTNVLVVWNAVAGATSYEIWRRAPGVSFLRIATTTATNYTDTSTAANTAYLYLIRAVNAGGTSGDSAVDLATTVIFTDDPLVAGVVIKAVHVNELRVAVNAVRALAGLATLNFTDTIAKGVIVKAYHITEPRSALDAARAALGLSTGGYTNPSLTGVVIKAIHIQELRNRVK